MSPTAAVAAFESKQLDDRLQRQGHLRLVLYPERLEYGLFHPESLAPLALGSVPFVPGHPLAQSLEAALGSAPRLKTPPAKTDLILALPYWTLLPKELLTANVNIAAVKYLETLHGISAEEYGAETHSIPLMGLEVVFGLPNSLKPLMGAQLAQAKLRHVAAHLLETAQQLDERTGGKETLHLTLLGGQLYLAIVRGKDLLFFNSFAVAYAEDALYYTLATVQQLGLAATKLSATLAGHAPFGATFQELLGPSVGKLIPISSYYRAHPELIAAGRSLEELAYFGADLLAPFKP